MKKRALAALLAFTLVFGGISSLPKDVSLFDTTIRASAADNITSGDFTYKVLDDGTISITEYNGKESSLTVPATIDGLSVSSIGSQAFYYSYYVKDITLSEGIKELGSYAFYRCSNINSISLPSTLETISSYSFYGSTIKSFTVSSANSKYTTVDGSICSKDKTELYFASSGSKEYVVPGTVKKINSFAIAYQSGLTSVSFPEGLEIIGSYAFLGCSSLKEVKLPSSIKELDVGAFNNCSALTTINLPKGLETIGGDCFWLCRALEPIALPEGLNKIGYRAFEGCTKWTSVTIPKSVKEIGSEAFGYDYVNSNTIGVDGFKVYCYYGTVGEQYAINNGIEYELIDPESFAANMAQFDNGQEISFNMTDTKHFYSQKQNGFFFIGKGSKNEKLVLTSLDTGKSETVYDFSDNNTDISLDSIVKQAHKDEFAGNITLELSSMSLTSYFVQGNKLYLLYNYSHYYNTGRTYNYVYTKVVYVYNTDSCKLEAYYSPDMSLGNYTAIGADQSGRIYLARSYSATETVTDSETGESSEQTTTKYAVDMYSSAFKKITTGEALTNVNYFCAFDNATGTIAMGVYYNWRYWGYDHAMTAIALGKAGTNTLEFSSVLVRTVGQRSYSDIDNPVNTVNEKYLCVDSPLSASNNLMNPASSGMDVYDFSKIYESINGSCKMSLNRDYYRNPGTSSINYYGSKYARTTSVPGGESTHIIAVDGSTKISEYDVEAGDNGTEIVSVEVAHPVYELFSDSQYVYVIMRDNDDVNQFYIQKLTWKKGTKLSLSASKLSAKVGEKKTLTATVNSSFDEQINWTSTNPKVASVNEDGVITAMGAGTAVITAANMYGLKATCTVTISDSALASLEGDHIKNSSGMNSNNLGYNSYSTWSYPMQSYICENSDKTISRVENINGWLVVETYSADGKTLKSTQKITEELPIFGGVYIGKDYNFAVFGQKNDKESDDVEVLRIVKYSKSWSRISSASVKGANTYIPFEAGSLRMTETGGKLYIHTCHQMYDEGDGLHHQANMTFVVNESSMAVEQQQYTVYNYTSGYVSHSFNQFIKTDGERVFRLDHGDASPRGLFLNYFYPGQSTERIGGKTILSFANSSYYNYNYTGASVGGFELTTHNCITAYASIDQKNFDNSDQKNIYIIVQNKDLSNDPKNIQITSYDENSGVTVGTPQLVKVNDDILLLMWQETQGSVSVTKTVTINQNGDLTSDIVKLKAQLSDCQPALCSDGLVRWYASSYSAPTFYSINPYYLSNYNSTIRGDVDMDGKVTMKDYALLLQYLNGWDVTIDEKAADINGDGSVKMKDYALLLQLLNGWDV